MSIAELAAPTLGTENRAMLPIRVVKPDGEETLHLVPDPRPGVCEQFMANMPRCRAYPVDLDAVEQEAV